MSPQPYQPEYDPIVGELLPDYLAECRAELPRLAAALAAADFETLWKVGHGLKGSGAGYGLPPVSDHGAALEAAAKARNTTAAAAALEALAAFLDRVVLPVPHP